METEFKNLTKLFANNSAEVYFDSASKSIIIRSVDTYIPIEEFKNTFDAVLDYARRNQVTKTIFDKRSLKVFHQPSMQWYFTEWKVALFDLGVKKHIKILPDDFVFKSSVKIGRQKIDELFPESKYHLTEILYCNSLPEALEA